MSKKKIVAEPQKQKTTVEIACDTGRLYDSLPKAIKYLQEVLAANPGTDISLDEHWIDYEIMEMRFTYSRLETDEEFAARLEREQAERDRAEAEAKRLAARKAEEAEYHRLAWKLGKQGV